MHIRKLLRKIEDILPAQIAMDGDKIGLQIQGGNNEISGILFALEVNEEIIREAKESGCDCIISFHPLIFYPIVSIDESERVGKLSAELIRNNITLIAIHTNFDAHPEGTSKILCDKLGLIKEEFLVTDKNNSAYGMGVLAKPEKPMTADELLKAVSNVCSSPLRYNRIEETRMINKIAIVGGSGSSFLDEAIESGADAFITADLSYHKFHAVTDKIMLIDPGHYEMEQFVPLGLKNLLQKHLNNDNTLRMQITKNLTNPVRYYPETEQYIRQQNDYLINL